MLMKRIANSLALTAVLMFCILVATGSVLAQADRTPKKRLTSPATVSGYIGGEAHDSYVIRARKGRILTVNISWRRRGKDRAEFSVSRSANFYAGGVVNFGVRSNGGNRWRGIIRRTADYYVYVVAHPTAQYTLKIDTK